MTQELSSLGESGLLSLIRKRFAGQRFPGLVLGPGDDAAVSRLKPGRVLVSTQDDLAENVHFETRWTDFRRLAHKLLRINLSDLAAMGAVEPLGVLVSAGFMPNSPRRWAQDFLQGLAEEARRFNVAVLGGNLSRSQKLFFSMTALGQARSDQILKRSGARAGDLIAGIGPLGQAALGLAELRAGERSGPHVRAFWEPEPQLAPGRVLAQKKLATSLVDNSDGLSRSCRLLAAESGLGFRLELNREVWKAAQSGEDYGLVFTVPPKKWPALKRALPPAYRLGVMQPKKAGTPLPGAGFDHFRRRP